VTDTFYYYGDLAVTEEAQDYDLTLTRAVAMFQMTITDEVIPAEVTKIRFYYTGGSSTFSPATGYGCVNSKQTEIRTVDGETKTFEIYTMPHDESDVLKLTVTAFDANDNALRMQDFDEVPVTRNQITRYTGAFFGGGRGASGERIFSLTADPEWDNVNGFNF